MYLLYLHDKKNKTTWHGDRVIAVDEHIYAIYTVTRIEPPATHIHILGLGYGVPPLIL